MASKSQDFFQVDEDDDRLISAQLYRPARFNANQLGIRKAMMLLKMKNMPTKLKNSDCDPVPDQLADEAQAPSVVTSTKMYKKTKSYKTVKKAGQRIEYIFRKGAKYFGIAVIKIFNQPQTLYTEESRVCCVC